MGSLKDFNRLKNNKEFSSIYNRSKKAHASYFVLFYKQGKKRVVGFTASKKVGNSVKRNFAKRRMKALFIEYSDLVENGSYIVVAKESITNSRYSDIKKSFYHLLKRVGALKKVK